MQPQRFTTRVAAGPRGQVYLPVPFDPDAVWGAKPVHHVNGTVNDMRVRGPISAFGDERGLSLGAAWRRDCGVSAGDAVEAVLTPEGPQRADLAPDLAEALAAHPEAAAFFDSLATFYRKGYLRWVNATTRRPELRAARVAELITHLAAGRKERP
ncbi:MAG: YdeI/OmpD-associated family protein [Labedaea sp.]